MNKILFLAILVFSPFSFSNQKPVSYLDLIRQCYQKFPQVMMISEDVRLDRAKLKRLAVEAIINKKPAVPIALSPEVVQLKNNYLKLLSTMINNHADDFAHAYLCVDFYDADFPKYEIQLIKQARLVPELKLEGGILRKLGNLGSYIYRRLRHSKMQMSQQEIEEIAAVTTSEDWNQILTLLTDLNSQELNELLSQLAYQLDKSF